MESHQGQARHKGPKKQAKISSQRHNYEDTKEKTFD